MIILTRSKWFIIIVLVIGIVIVLSVLLSFASGKSFEPLQSIFFQDQVRLPTEEKSSELLLTPTVGKPERLLIPKINIDAPVIPVNLTPSGAMDAPKKSSDVAWFDLGPSPGEIGSATISGHYGWKDGVPAAFDDLDKLQKGDRLYIIDEKGAVITFVVRESKIFNPEADASDIFVSSDGKAHLNLITCEGIWNKIAKSYSGRLVIFTDKE